MDAASESTTTRQLVIKLRVTPRDELRGWISTHANGRRCVELVHFFKTGAGWQRGARRIEVPLNKAPALVSLAKHLRAAAARAQREGRAS